MKTYSIFLILLQSIVTIAQAPQKMSYQSVVRNAANQIVVNQSIGVKISIIEGSLTGTTVYSETHTTTTNANGLFTLEAGGGTPITGTFSAINWGNGSHYIKSEIDVTGGVNYALSGTMELLSVPYALYAEKSAETALLQSQVASLQSQIKNLETFVQPSITNGTQFWSNINLNVSTYSDGTPIPEITDESSWSSTTTGAWCYYNFDPENGNVYGKLYNWYAVAGIYDAASLTNSSLRKKLAPLGWHIPSKNEWIILRDHLGQNSELGPLEYAGFVMKEKGTLYWGQLNIANNSSGFNGMPGGLFLNTQFYAGGGSTLSPIGAWWCIDLKIMMLDGASSSFPEFCNPCSQNIGASVRCVRD